MKGHPQCKDNVIGSRSLHSDFNGTSQSGQIQGQLFWEPKQSSQGEVTVHATTGAQRQGAVLQDAPSVDLEAPHSSSTS